MDAPLIPLVAPVAPRFAVPALPGWALGRGAVTDPREAAFRAGAALTSLDNFVRADPPFAGAWRARLALSCAVAAAQQMGRTEDEAALRDAWVLRAPNSDPGPAGRLFAAWRRLGERSPGADIAGLRSTCALLGIAWDDRFAALLDESERHLAMGRPAPLAAAAMLRAVDTVVPSAGRFGWWLADQMLARALRWPLAVPLLIVEAQSGAFRRAGGGGRLRPADEGFEAAVCVALVQGAARALRCAAEIAPRAAHLEAVAPKLRAKGAGEAIALLLGEDAVPGTLATAKLSRWGARRLFERLEALGAVRELSGRTAFRLYGL